MSVPKEVTSTSGFCIFCNKILEGSDPDVYHEVKAWAHGPKMDSPVLRHQTGKLACRDCIERLKKGQAADQEEIL